MHFANEFEYLGDILLLFLQPLLLFFQPFVEFVPLLVVDLAVVVAGNCTVEKIYIR